jgi:sugar/nucleoside kinase (ribokinase family)
MLVVGSIGLDTVKTPLGKRKEVLGGSATYAAVSGSYFNRVKLVSVVGKDFPKRYWQLFDKANLDVRGVKVARSDTFRWHAEYGWDLKEPRTIFTSLNAFTHFRPVLPEAYKKAKFVLLANIDPVAQRQVLRQLKKPKFIVCDTMNYWVRNKRRALFRVIKKIDMFVLNDTEARQATKENNLVQAGKILQKRGPRYVIIKKGEHGCLLFFGKYLFSLPGFLLESVSDPTGAGDSFAGAMVGYLANKNKITKKTIKKAAIHASIMATFAVEGFSVDNLLGLSQRRINKRLKEFRRQISFEL